MIHRSVLRGKGVLSFQPTEYGRDAGATFLPRPTVAADDIVLPNGVLDRILQHVVGIGIHREELIRAGQHLKRGVLLYGPPGTGKTLTVRHLLSVTPETTAIVLTGSSIRFITAAAEIARTFTPAIVVLEDIVRGHATITGADTVQVADTTYQARKAIILNTGTSPAVPPIPGLADTPFWTNRDAVAATTAPESLIVLGGGAVGVELGQVFARFGSTIDIVEAADRLLPAEEPESSSLIEDALTAEGIQVHAGSPAESVSHDGARFTVTIGETTLTAERLLVATGRRPNISDLGLDSIGVDATGRSLTTDDHGRLTDAVFAIGDITGRGAFTHVSVYQARIVVDTILGRDHAAGEYHAVPRVTFTDPEIGAVGLTEAEARRADLQITTALTQIPNSTRGWLHAIGNQGFIKLIVDSRRGILVGATSAGPVGGEVLSLLTLAVHERTPIEHLRNTIYAYPTFHRALDDALAQL